MGSGQVVVRLESRFLIRTGHPLTSPRIPAKTSLRSVTIPVGVAMTTPRMAVVMPWVTVAVATIWRRPVRRFRDDRPCVVAPDPDQAIGCAALLIAARRDGETSHALVALLGMLGLRISEAFAADVSDLSYQSIVLLAKALRHAHGPYA